MITPEIAWQRIIQCFLLGCILGPILDFLKPFHRRFPIVYQIGVCIILLPAWLILSFDICMGDIRIGYLAGCVAGYLLWLGTLHSMVCHVFDRFWQLIARLCGMIAAPVHNFLKKNSHNAKKALCNRAKMGYNRKK